MIPQILALLGAALMLVLPCQAIHSQIHNASFVPTYSLHISYAQAQIACRSRLSALVNGSSPGPLVTLQENRTTWIRVYNDMETENLTMHWHGLSQSVSPFSDGTPQASQWPIPAKHFFDYEIRPSIGEAGTYFYHSHIGFQAVTAAGPLIVEEASGSAPYKYHEERLLFLSELFNRTDAMVEAGLTAPSPSAFTWSGETERTLVNGKGIMALDANQTATPLPWANYSGPTTSNCGPEVIEVQPNTVYRFRAIGGEALSLTSFAFENHSSLSVIAADGGYTQATHTDHMQVGPGQRFDFLLKTKSNAELKKLGKTNFWIQFETLYRPVTVTSFAILSYVNTSHSYNTTVPSSPPKSLPLTLSDDDSSWLEYALQPLEPNNFPSASEVSRTVYLRSAQLTPQNGIFWTVNKNTWTEINEHLNDTSYNTTGFDIGTPYLVNIYKNGEAAIPDFETALSYGGWDPNLNVYAGEVGEVIDIVLINEPNGQTGGFDAHPWHIHGGHVYDLGSGPGDYNATANEKKLEGFNPVIRDTTMLYKYTLTDGVGTLPAYSAQGWRAWRLRIDDAGVWMVHCHILQHMIMGMQTVWVMGNASEITKNREPFVQGYLDYGGSAYGNASYDPLVMHSFSDD